MSPPESKRQKTDTTYELLYHPGIPGRGEFIRLVFEATNVPYIDVANSKKDGYSDVVRPLCCDETSTGSDGNPPMFSPPALRISNADRTDEKLVINQTPNILSYLGQKLDFAGHGDEMYHVAQVALTALDLNNEIHDTHHPVAVMKTYEDQKDQALLKATDFRENRLPKYLSYFERVLMHNHKHVSVKQKPCYMVGKSLTYADTTVWQVLDGLFFAFPNEMRARKAQFAGLLDDFYNAVKDQSWLADYLASDRRLEYSSGIFRHYPELDRQQRIYP